ncbi:hypothetical protein ACJMK2_008694 [Sinanodonta woodiana]|uniref:J domain-containing protein n=1 Tax=Sinanodonta woodiana TaxID=1069815 RepID=A0ABD3VN46_SINWO
MIVCQILLSCLLLSISEAETESLYDVLGVKRTASQNEIKQAYKKLAKDWHPDKNDDPNAADKFTKINEAYETLGRPDKRREYDEFGYTSATGRQPSHPHGGFHENYNPFSAFEQFFASGSGFQFHFGGNFGGIDKYSITLRQYETDILPNSHRKPCVIYVYNDFCFNCMRIENYVEKYLQELKAAGLCAATVHTGRDALLVSHLRIINVPMIMAVSAGRITYFKGTVNTQTLRDFTRTLFSPTIFSKVKDGTFQGFLNGFINNRVSAIFFGLKQDPGTRFLAPAFYYQDNIAFAYVCTTDPETRMLREKYNINNNRETLLLFNEETDAPVASISMQRLPRTTIDEVLESNKYLMLPRLSSQRYFDELCPEENKVKKRKLCVVLVTKKKKEHDQYRESFRKFSQKSKLAGHERIKFSYIYEDTQKDFVLALMKERIQENDTAPLKVAILWRVEEKKLTYEWLETGWDLQREKEKICEEKLENRLTVLLTTDSILPYRTNLPELYNEHAASLLVRIGNKLLFWADRIMLYFTRHDDMTWIAVFLSVIFVIGMGYFMHKLASIEEEKIHLSQPQRKHPRPPSRTFDEKAIHMYELRSSTYKELVKEADTGLTIVVLVDKESKDKLLQEFSKIVLPYSRYSALTFGFVQLEYHISWFRHLLQDGTHSLMNLSHINIHNCVGTVLALNGFRKCYYVYIAKRARKWIIDTRNVTQALGLMDSDFNSDEEQENEDAKASNLLFIDDLLVGLQVWLDKVFDGSVKKIKITEWPDMTDAMQS